VREIGTYETDAGLPADSSGTFGGRGWAAGQPETTGENPSQPVAKPQVGNVSRANAEVTDPAGSDL